MKLLFYLVLLLNSIQSHSQFFKRDSIDSKFIVGIHPNLYYSDFLMSEEPRKFARTFSLSIQPYFAYNIFKNMFIGTAFNYEFFYSNLYKRNEMIHLGLFARYVVPFHIDKKFLKRFHIYGEIQYNVTNYIVVSELQNVLEVQTPYKTYYISEDVIVGNKLNKNMFAFPIGLTFHLSRRLYLDFNWQFQYYPTGKNDNGVMLGVGYGIGHKK